MTLALLSADWLRRDEPMNSRSFLTVREVAELLRVPVTWVYARTRKRAANRIPGYRLGKYWRFQESEVLAWVQRQREERRVA